MRALGRSKSAISKAPVNQTPSRTSDFAVTPQTPKRSEPTRPPCSPPARRRPARMHAPRYQRMATRVPVPAPTPLPYQPPRPRQTRSIPSASVLPTCCPTATSSVFCDPDPAWLHRPRQEHPCSSSINSSNAITNTNTTTITTTFNVASAAHSCCFNRCC
jgi:hypothetical protein